MARVNRKAVYPRKWIIGVDEVGRGPLAGPITVAAVAAPMNLESRIWNLANIRDSKKLTALQREVWNRTIRGHFSYAVSSVHPLTIDKRGISYAAKLAVKRCLKKLSAKFHIPNSRFLVLLDGGLYAPSEYKNQQTIIKGDEKVPIIAAASIVAKVHRDRYMIRLHKKYPSYGFDKHKGYGTVMHQEAIIKNGLSEVHRKSFCGNLHYTDKMVQ